MSALTLNLTEPGWITHPLGAKLSLSLKGQVYRNDLRIDIHQLSIDFADCQTTHQLSAFLPRLNGFYACVEQSDGQIRAAVDHIRSRPLFYGLVEGRFYISDDAEWVRQQVGDYQMDPVAREEFQLAGYVTGAETLFPNVKQLQAGECLVASEDEEGVQVETQRYYRFLHTEPVRYDEPALREALDFAAEACIQRLIDYADGRQIVVPLSGGYDSRLIVSLLKRHGYENVLTFTYGLPGNKESIYSKLVADALGFRWHFVEYSDSLWREAWQTDERWDYQKSASGLSSIAHCQDWLAVKILNEQGIPDSDCLFVPGHTGDFISGGHIPAAANPGISTTQSALSDAVLRKHYGLAPFYLVTKRPKDFWVNRIHDRSDQLKVGDGVSLANASEKWEWQERQAKFICNAVRVYEFFDYDWWMPLWDTDFIKFWEKVPLELRKGKHWYVQYVSATFRDHSSEVLGKELRNASDDSRIYRISKWILNRSAVLKSTVKRLIIKFSLGSSQKVHDPLGIRGRYPDLKCREMIDAGYNMNGVNAHFLLDSLDRLLTF